MLKTLNLRRNNIGDEGATPTAIGEALRGNGVLKSIDLYGIPDLYGKTPRPPVDEDGFETVAPRRRRRGSIREGSDSRCGERAGRVRAQGVSGL